MNKKIVVAFIFCSIVFAFAGMLAGQTIQERLDEKEIDALLDVIWNLQNNTEYIVEEFNESDWVSAEMANKFILTIKGQNDLISQLRKDVEYYKARQRSSSSGSGIVVPIGVY